MVVWLKEAATAMRAAAALPVFPGDPDPIEDLLTRTVTKLYAVCWDAGTGDASGLTCGVCPVCRAMATEAAQQAAAAAQQARLLAESALAAQTAVLASCDRAAADFSQEVDRLTTAIVAANDQVQEALATIEALAADLAEQTVIVDEAAAAEDRLRTELNHRTEALAIATTRLTALDAARLALNAV